MRIVCATICYRDYANDEFAATLENAPKVGYRYMEIHGPMTWDPEAIKAFDLPTARERIKAAGLRCVGIYPPGWGGKDAADVQRRAKAIARAVELVEGLGGDHIATTSAERRAGAQGNMQWATEFGKTTAMGLAPTTAVSGGLGRVIECVRQVLDQVSPTSQVKLALEPHYGNVLQEPEDFAAVLDAVPDPRVGVCVDTGHFHSAHVDTPALIRRFAPRIYGVHLKDHLGTKSVGIGRGEIDLASVIATLREVDYKGDLTIELEVEDPEDLPRYTEEAYCYVSGLLGAKL